MNCQLPSLNFRDPAEIDVNYENVQPGNMIWPKKGTDFASFCPSSACEQKGPRKSEDANKCQIDPDSFFDYEFLASTVQKYWNMFKTFVAPHRPQYENTPIRTVDTHEKLKANSSFCGQCVLQGLQDVEASFPQ